MSDDCDSFESSSALKIAKNNVEKYFAVVGIMERWQESLQLFEHYVPAYFRNARKIFNSTYKRNTYKLDININDVKPKTPEYIKKIVSMNFTLELEFYEFCQQRFHRQLLAIK